MDQGRIKGASHSAASTRTEGGSKVEKNQKTLFWVGDSRCNHVRVTHRASRAEGVGPKKGVGNEHKKLVKTFCMVKDKTQTCVPQEGWRF